MSLVELIPLSKGHPIIIDETVVTTIGRSPKIGCSDNKISRNHAQVSIKSDGTVWVKGIHHNPTFYKTKTNQIVSLTKDKEYQLFNNDQFGLLPDEYFYRVSFKSKEDQNPAVSSSTTSKSPIQDKETLTIENHAEENSEPVSNPVPTLPTSTSVNSPPTTTNEEERNQVETTSSTSPVNKQTNSQENKPKGNIYDDDTDDDEPTTTTTAEQTNTSNPVDTTAKHSTTTTSSSSAAAAATARSNKRERCPYGTTCYRTNPIHRQQASHPGDSDWDTDDDEEEEESAKPVCPYGDECYRTNPDHLNEYDHPKKRSKETNKKRRTIEYDDDDDDEGNTTNDNDSSSDGFDNDDIEWKPEKKSRYLDDSDDASTDSDDKELTKQEAERFIKSSTSKHHGHLAKKPRSEDDE